MATKQLQVIIKAVDQFTAPMRTALGGVVRFGQGVVSVAGVAGRGLLGLLKHFTSITGIVQALVVGKILGGVAQSFHDAAERLNEIGDLSRRFEIPVEQLRELRFVARAAGLDLGVLANALDKGQGALGEFAQTGRGPAGDSLRRLGIQLRDSEGRTRHLVELLPELAIQLEKLPDNASRLNALGGIFGKVDDDILQLFNLGAERIAALQAQARGVSNVFTPEQVALAQRYRQAVQGVQDAWLGLKIRLFGEVGPFLTEFFERAAVVLANVPRILGNIGSTIRDALFGEGAAQAQAAAKFTALFGSLAALGETALNNLARVLLGVSIVATRAYFAVWGSEVEGGFRQVIGNLQLKIGGLFGFPVEEFRRAMDTLKQALSPGEAFVAFNARLSDSGVFTRELSGAWSQFRGEVGSAIADVLRAGDAIVGLGAAFDGNTDAVQRAIDGVRRLRELLGQPTAARGNGFIDGMREAADELSLQTTNLFEQGRLVYSGIAQQISGNLSTALVSAAADVRNLGDYFKEFFSSTLRGVSQLITQMLVLRAVSAIGSALVPAAGAAGGAPVVGGPETIPGGSSIVFSTGEPVASINTGKPSVPGFGGYRGGGDAEAGGAVVSVSIVVNLAGSSAGREAGPDGVDPRLVAAIKRAAIEGVFEGLANSASHRDRLRRLLV